MDAAKAIAVVASNGGDYWDYIPCGTGKGKAVAETPLPIVAITTTAGTGSETDAGCVITNAETHEKTGFVHPGLFPVLAVVDPELMLTVPPKFTAFQGFDALFHSTEAYISNAANLMSDMYVLNAIENVARYLPRAVADGSDLEARTRVAWGNTLSGSVMCVGALHERTFARTCDVGLPPGAAARRRPDYDFESLLRPFHRTARLRRAFRGDGPCAGRGRCPGADGFHSGARGSAAGVRCGGFADVRLRYFARRISGDGPQCQGNDGLPVSVRPGAAFGRGVRSHLQGVVSVRGWFRIGPRSENAARGSLRGMIHTIEIFTNKI